MTKPVTTETAISDDAIPDIAETAAMATELAKRTDDLETWLTSQVTPAWNEFLTGLRQRNGDFFSDTYQRADTSGRSSYDTLTLGAEGATFAGTYYCMGESENESYTIPWAFIHPATREQAKADIAEAYEAEASADHARKQAQRERKYQESVQQMARQAADLGLALVPAADASAEPHTGRA